MKDSQLEITPRSCSSGVVLPASEDSRILSVLYGGLDWLVAGYRNANRMYTVMKTFSEVVLRPCQWEAVVVQYGKVCF
jgi:hypothetical protein